VFYWSLLVSNSNIARDSRWVVIE